MLVEQTDKELHLKIYQDTFIRESSCPKAKYSCYSYQAKGLKPKAYIYFFHGLFTHSEVYRDFFYWLIYQSQGALAIKSMDLIGHGQSTGARGHLDQFDHLIDDFFDFINSAEKGSKVIVIGQGLGGTLHLKSQIEHQRQISSEILGFVSVAPLIKMHHLIRFPNRGDLLDFLKSKVARLRIPLSIDFCELFDDKEKASELLADVLFNKFMTIGMYQELQQACSQSRVQSYYLNKPNLFIIPENDVLADSETTKLFAQAMDHKICSIKPYPNEKHEVLLSNKHVWQDIFQWLKATVSF